MVDYSCAVTTRYLSDALDHEAYLTPETLRADYLDGGGTVDLAVPINSMMIATFFLVIMDTSFRITCRLQSEVSDWERTMVIIAGQQGRPTAGVTLSTNSVATMILGASRGSSCPRSGSTSPPTPQPSTHRSTGICRNCSRWKGHTVSSGAAPAHTVELGEVMYVDIPATFPRQPARSTSVIQG